MLLNREVIAEDGKHSTNLLTNPTTPRGARVACATYVGRCTKTERERGGERQREAERGRGRQREAEGGRGRQSTVFYVGARLWEWVGSWAMTEVVAPRGVETGRGRLTRLCKMPKPPPTVIIVIVVVIILILIIIIIVLIIIIT